MPFTIFHSSDDNPIILSLELSNDSGKIQLCLFLRMQRLHSRYIYFRLRSYKLYNVLGTYRIFVYIGA